jgi:membrane protein implicated in regulation of membrane protease activity
MGIVRLLFFAALALMAYLTWRRVQRFLDGRPDPAKMRKTGRPAQTAENDGRVLNEMEKCGVCGTYVAAGIGRCNRADCPRR